MAMTKHMDPSARQWIVATKSDVLGPFTHSEMLNLCQPLGRKCAIVSTMEFSAAWLVKARRFISRQRNPRR
jgi:hypothetical protein